MQLLTFLLASIQERRRIESTINISSFKYYALQSKEILILILLGSVVLILMIVLNPCNICSEDFILFFRKKKNKNKRLLILCMHFAFNIVTGKAVIKDEVFWVHFYVQTDSQTIQDRVNSDFLLPCSERSFQNLLSEISISLTDTQCTVDNNWRSHWKKLHYKKLKCILDCILI